VNEAPVPHTFGVLLLEKKLAEKMDAMVKFI
jgi:hypothetical protein